MADFFDFLFARGQFLVLLDIISRLTATIVAISCQRMAWLWPY
jgi:hypothetical protein